MIRLLLAGPRDFTDTVQRQAKNFSDIRLATVATEPSVTVDALENRSYRPDAVLLGFDDKEIEIMMDVAARNQVSAVLFVSTDNPAVAYRKWQPYRAKVAPAGKELEAIIRFFKDRPDLLKIQDDRKATLEEDVERRESDHAARVQVVREREERNRVVSVDRKTIVLFGQKGGIGKTVTTISLARSLATLTNMRVAVLDLDINRDYGDIIRYFGYLGASKARIIEIKDVSEWKGIPLPQEKTLSAWTAFPFEMKFDRRLVEFCMVQMSKNLFVLPPARSIMDMKGEVVNYDFVQKVVDALRRHFTAVVVDGGNTLSTQTLAAMEMCDELLIVSSADLPVLDSLADFTTNTINVVHGCFVVSLVINGVTPDSPRNLEKELPDIARGYPVIAMFPWDEALHKMVSTEAQVPYMGAHDIPYTKEMEKLLYHIFPKETFKRKETGKRLLGSFFERLRIAR